jgi:hypothetical protein
MPCWERSWWSLKETETNACQRLWQPDSFEFDWIDRCINCLLEVVGSIVCSTNALIQSWLTIWRSCGKWWPWIVWCIVFVDLLVFSSLTILYVRIRSCIAIPFDTLVYSVRFAVVVVPWIPSSVHLYTWFNRSVFLIFQSWLMYFHWTSLWWTHIQGERLWLLSPHAREFNHE